jgi:hypothetical protein
MIGRPSPMKSSKLKSETYNGNVIDFWQTDVQNKKVVLAAVLKKHKGVTAKNKELAFKKIKRLL